MDFYLLSNELTILLHKEINLTNAIAPNEI